MVSFSMFPCQACHRHIREQAGDCPFCGAAIRQEHGLRELVGVLIVGASLLGSVGCGSGPVAQDTSETQTTDATTDPQATSSETTMGAETETDTGDETDAQTNTSGGFYAGPDIDIAPIQDCDPFAQDCPEGEKCVPYGSTGGNWDANKCVPVLGDGAAGESCTYDGVVTATDSCNAETHCWHVQDVEGMNVGTCTPFCTGSPDDPQCPSETTCLMGNEGSINLCISLCNPLMPECMEQDACYWTGTDFLCIYRSQDLAVGEPCGFVNDCAPGLWCAPAEALPSCNGSSCCAAYCDTSDPEACPDPELGCVPFFDAPAPAGFESVGVCVLPPP